MPKLSDRVGTFTDSVIRRMTRISDEYGAINLFPRASRTLIRPKRFWMLWPGWPMKVPISIR